MSTGWSEERRARQRDAIRTWQPWTKSTGPSTDKGKLRASMNRLRHGRRASSMRRLEALLRMHRQWLALVRAHFEANIFSANELLALLRLAPSQEPGRALKDNLLRQSSELMLYLVVTDP